MTLTFIGCNDHYEHNGVHVMDSSGNANDITIKMYYKEKDGIKCYFNDGNSVFLPNGTYILFNNTCPICGSKK